MIHGLRGADPAQKAPCEPFLPAFLPHQHLVRSGRNRGRTDSGQNVRDPPKGRAIPGPAGTQQEFDDTIRTDAFEHPPREPGDPLVGVTQRVH